MENLYSKMYEQYVQKCKEQKVDAKDIKFKLWIENGRINHSVVWEFKDENNN